MDFEINYDLPYLDDIYKELNCKYPNLFCNNIEIDNIFENYFNFVYFVKYIVSKDMKILKVLNAG